MIRSSIKRACSNAGALFFAVALGTAAAAAPAAGEEWATYGHDPGGQRYSPLKQITARNVGALGDAWTYRMRPAAAAPLGATGADAGAAVGAGGDGQASAEAAQRAAEGAAPLIRRRSAASRFNASQATPLVVKGVMYLSTPYQRVVALDATTGRELWVYQVPGTGQASQRGVEYWPGDRQHAPRIVFGTRDGRLIALEADTGKPAAGFGVDGIVELKTADILPPSGTPQSPFGQYGMTSPPIVYKHLVITGSAVQEAPAIGASGDVRAWDMRSGALLWTFHTVPRPGEFGHDTWAGESWRNRSGVNAWGFLTVDARRGIVYFPVGAPAWDRAGIDRAGDNLFSGSVVAVDANTGKRLWHFQMIRHDIWDWDPPAPPLLLEVRRDRRKVPAVALVGKTGMYFLLNRVTGEPLLPIEYRKVPASDVPGEQAAAMQPFSNTVFARQSFSLDEVATLTPELETFCRDWIVSNNMLMGGMYQPLAFNRPTISFPGRQGGANWGGGSYHPKLDLLFVNANNLAQVEQIKFRADGSAFNADPTTGRFSQRESKLMCQQPPWGTLTAIRASSGEIVWQKPLGVSDVLPEAVRNTGRPNVGGSIVTAGGVVFIGAADDARFRAFDAESGAELWTVKLAAAAHATPITYQGKDRRQYVAVVGTGGSFLDSPIDSDEVRVFALPR